MTQSTIDIEVVLLLEKNSGKEKIVYLFADAPANEAMELFITKSGSNFVLYHPDAYYDNVLRQRRQNNNMILSKTQERLIYVGNVWRDLPCNIAEYLVLGDVTLPSEKILINEK